MSTPVILNGITYTIPTTGDIGWGTNTTNYLVALGNGVLSLAGGNFTLTNDVNFGPNHGVKAPFFASGLAGVIPATQGVVRLGNAESIMWRNAANTGNLDLAIVSDQLYFAGNPIGGTPLTTKGDLITFSTSAVRLPVGLNGEALIADSSEVTGLKWANIGGTGGSVVGFTFTDANGIAGTVATATSTPNLTLSLGAITPTSVTASGIVTGSNISGTNTGDQTITLTGAVTGSGSGSFATSYAGIVPIANGGTGQTTANAALNALLPSQASNSGKLLYTNGTDTSWVAFTGVGTVSSVSGANGVTVSSPTTTPVIGLGAITPTSVVASGNVTGANISGTSSGTNTGDQTISLSGDASGVWSAGNIPVVLANTSVTPGTYTRASITVDSKGRITSASTNALQTITLTGDVTGSGTGSFATTISNTGVTAGTYNNVTVNAKGQATAGSNQAYLLHNEIITATGDATGVSVNAGGATSLALTLANTSIAAGQYAVATYDSKGRATAGTTLIGDVTSSGRTVTLNTVNSNIGTFVASTVNAKGLVTAAGNLSGDATTSGSVLTLSSSGVTAGSYTLSNITVDSKGRVTAASTPTSASLDHLTLTAPNGNDALIISNNSFIRPTDAMQIKTNITGGHTYINAIPNGLVTDVPLIYRSTGFTAWGFSDTANSSYISMFSGAQSDSGTFHNYIQSSADGTGTVLPLVLQVGDPNSTPPHSDWSLMVRTDYKVEVKNDLIADAAIIATGNISTAGNLAATGTISGSNFSGTSSGTNTGDQTITLTGDVTGSGTGSFATSLAATGVGAGTYNSVTVNTKGLVTAASNKIFSGKATLVAGTVTVSTTNVTSSSVIQLTHQVLSGAQGMLRVGNITTGSLFTIFSSSPSDTSVIGWTIFN